MSSQPPPTLLLPPRYTGDSNALWRAAVALDWEIERLQSWRVPSHLAPAGAVAIYGESLWANFVAKQLNLRLVEPPLDWLATLPPEFVGRHIEFCTLRAAREKSFPLFVKPAGEKEFAARVYACAADLPQHDWQQSTWVLVSEVVEWEVEYRCFVGAGRVATASSYWRGAVSTQDEGGAYPSPLAELESATELVERLLARENGKYGFGPHGAVVDAGLLRGGGWAIIEANPAFAAGIYGCDPETVLRVVAHCRD